jgi:hypothetical protein
LNTLQILTSAPHKPRLPGLCGHHRLTNSSGRHIIVSVGDDEIDAGGRRFEFVDLDGRRIDKVLASRPDTV